MTREPATPAWLRALGIQRVYVLTCDPARLTAFLARQVALGRPLGHVEVWSQEPDTTDGVRGCRYGHLGILNQCMDDATTSVLVLEDDVLFDHGFQEKLETGLQWLNEHRDWGGVWLGGLPAEQRGSYDIYRETEHLVKFPGLTLTTHAYVLRGVAIATAAFALALVDLVGGTSADVLMAEALRGNVYTFMPAIAGQARGHSMVDGAYREERW
jgi:Glycosyltransferase family 25 (LPS biosynthesis protein)